MGREQNWSVSTGVQMEGLTGLTSARVGVIGGSGLYAIQGLTEVTEHRFETPFGPTSDGLRVGVLNGMETVFLARHGQHHHLLPSEVP